MIKKSTVMETLEKIQMELECNSNRDTRRENWTFLIENEVLYGKNKYHIFSDEQDNYIGYVYFKMYTEKVDCPELIDGFYIDTHVEFDENNKTGLETPEILKEIADWVDWAIHPHWVD